MKVLCKQSYIIHSDGTELYTEGQWYEVLNIDKFPNGKIIAYSIVNNLPNIFDDYYFGISDMKGYRFNEYFITEQEIRKQKLEKIHDKY